MENKNEEIYVTVYTALGGLIGLSDQITEGVKVLTEKDEKHPHYTKEIQVPVSLLNFDSEDDFCQVQKNKMNT